VLNNVFQLRKERGGNTHTKPAKHGKIRSVSPVLRKFKCRF
jgi:hypothetical protein